MASIHSDLLEKFRKNVAGGLTYHVVGLDSSVEKLFHQTLGFDKEDNIKEADIVVFTGGADIHPKFYQEKPYNGKNFYNTERDIFEFFSYKALSKSQIKVGICRGGQLLNVLNGGKLWQNVDNHGRNHKILDLDFDVQLNVVSTHHQQMIPNFETWSWIPVAVACRNVKDITTLCNFKEGASTRITVDHLKNIDKNAIWDPNNTEAVDHEVLYYPEDAALCFQSHPEYMQKDDTTGYFMDCLEEILTARAPFAMPKREPGSYLQTLLKGKKK